MSAEVTSLVVAVDSTQVNNANAALDKFARAGQGAEKAADALARASSKSEQAQARLAIAVQKAQGAQDALNKLIAVGPPAQDQFERAQARVAGAQAALGAATLRVAQAQKETAKASTVYNAALAATGKQSQLTAFQSQQLGFQLHDFFVQVVSGQSILTAFVQQGSQLSGTFGGARNTLRALSTVVTGSRVALLGVAAAAAAAAFSFEAGTRESTNFQRSLILTGNAAGFTEGKFNAAAEGIAASTKTSIGSTRETLQALVASGRFGGQAATEAATSVQFLAKVTGKSTDDILKAFIGGAEGVSQFAGELNKTYNFLNAEQLRNIRTAEEQGDRQKALEQVFAALNPRLREAASNAGLAERAYGGLERAASRLFDALKKLGRAPTLEDQLAEVRRRMDDNGAFDVLGNFTGTTESTEALKVQGDALRALVSAKEADAKAEAIRLEKQQAGIDFDKLKEQSLSRQQQLVVELAKANALADKAGIKGKPLNDVLSNIREKYADKGAESALRAAQKAKLESDLSAIKTLADAQVNSYKNAESILDAQRAANLLADSEYFESKREYLRLNEQAEVAALQAESARLSVENIALGKRKENAKEVIDNQKQIAENQAKIDLIQADTTAKSVVIDIQKADALQRIARAYRESQEGAKAYLASLALQQGRELEGIGIGEQGRRRIQGLNDIEDRFTQQRLQLESERRQGVFQNNEQGYRAELDLLERTRAEALQLYSDYFDKVLTKQRDFQYGVNEALQNYVDQSKKLGSISEGIVSNSLKGAEDVLTDFFSKGKADAKSFALSIVTDINRAIVQTQIIGPAARSLQGQAKSGEGVGGFLSDLLGNVLGQDPAKGAAAGGATASLSALAATATANTVALTTGTTALATLAAAAGTAATALASVAGSSALNGVGSAVGGDPLGDFIGTLLGGGRAIGGPVSKGKLYRVNENGPGELLNVGNKQYLMAGQYGSVQPTAGAGRPIQISQHFVLPGATDLRTQEQIAAKAGQGVSRAVARST